jgi:hypothetical protein
MFKAAVEYTMGEAITTRSLVDQKALIEKNILDGHTKIRKQKNNIQILDTFGTDNLMENSTATDAKKPPNTALPVA